MRNHNNEITVYIRDTFDDIIAIANVEIKDLKIKKFLNIIDMNGRNVNPICVDNFVGMSFAQNIKHSPFTISGKHIDHIELSDEYKYTEIKEKFLITKQLEDSKEKRNFVEKRQQLFREKHMNSMDGVYKYE
jgi:hypothetical protein